MKFYYLLSRTTTSNAHVLVIGTVALVVDATETSDDFWIGTVLLRPIAPIDPAACLLIDLGFRRATLHLM